MKHVDRFISENTSSSVELEELSDMLVCSQVTLKYFRLFMVFCCVQCDKRFAEVFWQTSGVILHFHIVQFFFLFFRRSNYSSYFQYYNTFLSIMVDFYKCCCLNRFNSLVSNSCNDIIHGFPTRNNNRRSRYKFCSLLQIRRQVKDLLHPRTAMEIPHQ